MYNAIPGLNSLSSGSMVSMRDLRDLNAALRSNGQAIAKGSVGTIQQGSAFSSVSGSELAPLVPQSIQATLDSATFTRDHIVCWKRLPKVDVSSTLHESNVINEHGDMVLDPFIAEGGTGPISEASYERKIVKVKYLAEHIELSDVSTMVGITGVDRSALAQRTQDGTLALLGKLERALFHADEGLNDLHFDGFVKQVLQTNWASNAVSFSGNNTNQDGAALTPQLLQEILGSLMGTPNYSMPNVVMVEPRAYQTLVNNAVASGRHDMLSSNGGAGGRSLTFGARDLFISGPGGTVPIIPCPLLARENTPNAAAVGGSSKPSQPAAPASTAQGTSGGKLLAAGTYKYKIAAVNSDGVSEPREVSEVVSASNIQKITINMDDGSVSDVKYYRVWRTDSTGDASTYKFMMDIPFKGGYTSLGSATSIVDDGTFIPGSSVALVGQMDPSVVYWTQLLDFTRRPLAQTKTTIPFLLMLFGALHVKVPTKWHCIRNVGSTI